MKIFLNLNRNHPIIFPVKVIVRPRVQELFNHTYPVGREAATLTCLASGDPLPKIVWRKWSRK